MQNKIEKIIELMKAESAEQQLPKFFQGDLDIDFEHIRSGVSTRFVWLLRESGTQLGPIGVGYNPGMVMPHIEELRSSSTKFYVIDILNVTVTETKDSVISEMINRPPALMAEGAEDIIMKARETLSKGVQHKLWGLFEQPKSVDEYTLAGWLQYFTYHRNSPMEQFMRNVMTKLKRHRQLLAA